MVVRTVVVREERVRFPPSAFGAERQKRLAEFDKIPASAFEARGEK